MTSNKVLPGEQPNEMNNNACDHPPCQPQVVTLPPPDGGPGTKATRKVRNRRGRSDAIEHKLYCFSDSKRGRAQSESMIQCHACQTWAHYECIGEGENDISSNREHRSPPYFVLGHVTPSDLDTGHVL